MIDLPKDFVAECQQLAKAIAPEIDCPLYILPQPAGSPAPQCCEAYAEDAGNVLLQEHLESRGEWNGPGLFVVFAKLSGHHESDVGVFLHELSHLLPFNGPPAPISPIGRSLEARSLQLAVASQPESAVTREFDLKAHGERFTRACLHVAFRANMHGHYVCPPYDALRFAGENYQQSHGYAYFQAIGGTRGELSAMFDLPISQILDTPAPDAFQELAARDLERRRTLTKEPIQ